ncbi:MAG: galactonate dehydratase, partial [Victivallaceae bacterium]|nr:galactonate dehydratase [Victivallaceae bacterium]
MKITAIKTFLCHCYRTNWVFVKVETDAGIHGWGESTLEYKEHAVEAAIHELDRVMIGRDPRRIEQFRSECYRDAYWRGGPVLMSAISGIEIALWDILGKSLDAPVWQLLGGKVRESVPCYVNGWFSPAKTPDEFAEKAQKVRDLKFKGLKWDPFGKAFLTIPKPALAKSIECVRKVAEVVGDDVELLIEGHGRFDVPTALRIARELEPFNVLWFEEPTVPDNLEALAQVKARSRVAIAAGERLYGRQDYRDFFRLQAADFAQPDVSHAGGIMEIRQIAAQAENAHIGLCPHNPSGPVANAATLQLAGCIPNFMYLETMMLDVPYRAEICDEKLIIRDGEM